MGKDVAPTGNQATFHSRRPAKIPRMSSTKREIAQQEGGSQDRISETNTSESHSKTTRDHSFLRANATASDKAQASPTRGSIVAKRSMYALQREPLESRTDIAIYDPFDRMKTSKLIFKQPGEEGCHRRPASLSTNNHAFKCSPYLP